MDATQNPPEKQIVKTKASKENSSSIAHETQRTHKEKILGEERLLVLCDGIFAIATTLLVLNIQVPAHLNEADFNKNLSSLFSNGILFYIITFYVIASFWIQHRRIMQRVKYVDGRFNWLTLLFLAFVAFFPVSSNILGQYSYQGAVLLYTLTFAGCGLSLLFVWLYAAWHHRLIEPDFPRDQIVSRSIQIALTPVYFSLSLLLLPFFPGHPTRIFWSWVFLPVIAYPIHLIQQKQFPSFLRHWGRSHSEKPQD